MIKSWLNYKVIVAQPELEILASFAWTFDKANINEIGWSICPHNAFQPNQDGQTL